MSAKSLDLTTLHTTITNKKKIKAVIQESFHRTVSKFLKM